jgi:hypothetical protein
LHESVCALYPKNRCTKLLDLNKFNKRSIKIAKEKKRKGYRVAAGEKPLGVEEKIKGCSKYFVGDFSDCQKLKMVPEKGDVIETLFQQHYPLQKPSKLS